LENGLCLCFTCHRFAHEQPFLWIDWLEKNLGKQFCEKLQTLSNATFKRSRDLDNWKTYLKEQEKELTN